MKLLSRKSRKRRLHFSLESHKKRWGSIILLAAGMMVMVFGFLAFSVDVGYIALTKAQLETASDAGARAAAIELKDGLGEGATKTPDEAKAAATQAAVDVAAANRAGDVNSVYADPSRDLRFGQVTYDPGSGTWVKQWGVSPYNMVELTLHRDQVPTSDSTETGQGDPVSQSGDHPLPLFFAPVIGHRDASLYTKATSALLPGNGFRVPAGSEMTMGALPFALDEDTWLALLRKDTDPKYGFEDNFRRDPETEAVSNTSDGIWECNLYPEGDSSLPPGNRGTVDIGGGNNSTSDLSRQILDGLNESDLSYYPNNTVPHQVTLNGDTGISAGFKEELEDIRGQSKLIPIFRTVIGNGDNAMYEIVDWVGVTVVDVKLVGNPKRVMVQPCPFYSQAVLPDYSGAPITQDTYFTSSTLIQ